MTPELALMQEHFPVETKVPINGQRIVPFVANVYQLEIDAALEAGERWHDVVKARQLGISTFIDYRALAKCLLSTGTHAAIISHERQATARLLRRVHFVLGDLIAKEVAINGKVVKTKYSSKYELTFPDTNSSLYIGTAGQRAFSRGDMLNFVHGSEVAYWPQAAELMGGVIGALTQDAEVFLESTGNGMGGYFYERIMAAGAA